jgi:hypothetical protein
MNQKMVLLHHCSSTEVYLQVGKGIERRWVSEELEPAEEAGR